jgi:2'-5' RNA ligase
VQAARFRLRLASLQCWHGGRLCCLSAGTVPRLLQLHRQLRACARRAGIAIEARALHPHITLARDVPREVAAAIDHDVPALWLAADAFCLVASEPHAQAARYRVLRRWPLRHPAARR